MNILQVNKFFYIRDGIARYFFELSKLLKKRGTEFHISFINRRGKKRVEIYLVTAFIFLYTLAAIIISLNRYWRYNAYWADFGQLDTTIWKLSRFQIPVIFEAWPPFENNVWGFHCHLNPSVAFLAPLYWFTDRQEIIFIAQAVSVGLSAMIAYLIALKFVKSGLVRIFLIVSFLGYVGLQNALESDVHSIVFAVLPLMLTIWAIYRKSWKLYWIFLIITMGFQEDMALVAVGLGLFLILRREKQIKTGILTILAGFVYGILAMYIIMPYLNGGLYPYTPLIPVIWQEWITKFIFPVNLKLHALFFTFATFGFLPVISYAAIPLIVIHYLERFVFADALIRWSLDFHYNATLSPIMFLALLEIIISFQNNAKIRKLLPYWAGVAILNVIFLHFYLKGSLMLILDPYIYEQTRYAKSVDNFVNQIPKKGLIMAQNNIATRFAHGETILLDENFGKILPDTIAVYITNNQVENDFYGVQKKDIYKFISSVSASPLYLKREVADKQFIFTRKLEVK